MTKNRVNVPNFIMFILKPFRGKQESLNRLIVACTDIKENLKYTLHLGLKINFLRADEKTIDFRVVQLFLEVLIFVLCRVYMCPVFSRAFSNKHLVDFLCSTF